MCLVGISSLADTTRSRARNPSRGRVIRRPSTLGRIASQLRRRIERRRDLRRLDRQIKRYPELRVIFLGEKDRRMPGRGDGLKAAAAALGYGLVDGASFVATGDSWALARASVAVMSGGFWLRGGLRTRKAAVDSARERAIEEANRRGIKLDTRATSAPPMRQPPPLLSID